MHCSSVFVAFLCLSLFFSTHAQVCGNGVTEEGEECDEGSQNTSPESTCSPVCTVAYW